MILYFERIIEQNIHNREYYYHGVVSEQRKEQLMQKQMEYLIPMIKSHVTQSKEPHVPLYIYHLFSHFCRSKTDLIDLSCIHEERAFMCKALRMIFFRGKAKERRLNNDRIKDLFPKLQSYRDEHGLLVQVGQISVNHDWYDDIKRANGKIDDDGDRDGDGDDRKYADEPEKSFDNISKPDPGECWADQYPDKRDPRGEPDEIPFKWNKNFKEKKQCDTLHMLYLLQMACDLHRRRVIERNKYFTSISRPDRYIDHVDGPQIITNILKWHNKDKDNNVLLGEWLTSKSELFWINDIISDIGMNMRSYTIPFDFNFLCLSQ